MFRYLCDHDQHPKEWPTAVWGELQEPDAQSVHVCEIPAGKLSPTFVAVTCEENNDNKNNNDSSSSSNNHKNDST